MKFVILTASLIMFICPDVQSGRELVNSAGLLFSLHETSPQKEMSFHRFPTIKEVIESGSFFDSLDYFYRNKSNFNFYEKIKFDQIDSFYELKKKMMAHFKVNKLIYMPEGLSPYYMNYAYNPGFEERYFENFPVRNTALKNSIAKKHLYLPEFLNLPYFLLNNPKFVSSQFKGPGLAEKMFKYIVSNNNAIFLSKSIDLKLYVNKRKVFVEDCNLSKIIDHVSYGNCSRLYELETDSDTDSDIE